MNTIKLFFTLSLTFILIFVFTVEAQDYRLTYKFEKGKTYRYKNVSNTNVIQEAMGQEMKISVDANTIQKILVDDIVDSSMVLIVSFDSITVATKMPMRDTTMNLHDLVNKRTKIYLSPEGKVSRKEILDSLNQTVQAFQQIQGEALKFFKLPEIAIQTGGLWNSTDSDTISIMGGDIISISNTEYTLTGKLDTLGHDCVKISFSGKSNNEGKAKIMGMDLFVEGNGKTSGVFYFDPAKGVLIHADVQVDNEMTMATTGEQNMIIPITQSTKVKQMYLED